MEWEKRRLEERGIGGNNVRAVRLFDFAASAFLPSLSVICCPSDRFPPLFYSIHQLQSVSGARSGEGERLIDCAAAAATDATSSSSLGAMYI